MHRAYFPRLLKLIVIFNKTHAHKVKDLKNLENHEHDEYSHVVYYLVSLTQQSLAPGGGAGLYALNHAGLLLHMYP